MAHKIEYRVIVTERSTRKAGTPEDEADNLRDIILDALGHPDEDNVEIRVETILIEPAE